MDEDPEIDEFIRNYTDNENAAKLKTIITEKNKTIALGKMRARELERELESEKRLNTALRRKNESMGSLIGDLKLRLLTEQTEAEHIPDVIKCNLCNNSFETNSSLREHINNIHTINTSPTVPTVVNTIEEPNEISTTDTSPTVATVVDIIEEPNMISNTILDNSSQNRGTSNTSKCRLCDFSATTRDILRNHMKTKHKALIF